MTIAATNPWELYAVDKYNTSLARCNYATELADALERAKAYAKEHRQTVVLQWGDDVFGVEP